MNNQEVNFTDSITVPTGDESQTKYILTGYVTFVGATRAGHYTVICKGEGDRWFLYDDEKTKSLTYYERTTDKFKRQVVLLMYTERSYYEYECVINQNLFSSSLPS